MVILRERMRIGEKGQVVIPHLFRKIYHFFPGEEVVFEEHEKGILIEKPPLDVVTKANEAAMQIKAQGKRESHKEYEEQLERRLKRAGVSL